MATVRTPPAAALAGTLRVPSDKSITHRALMLGALSEHAVSVDMPLDSADTAATANAVAACGAEVDGLLGDHVVVHGRGVRGLRPHPAIDCANAGTLMRLFAGILVGQDGESIILDGDASLRGRPMARVANPLRAMGASIFTAPGGTPPLVVSGGAPLRALRHELKVASAQVKSAILLAGMYADGETWVVEPTPSRDHTERMLAASGVDVLRDGSAVGVRGPVASLDLPDMAVPADFSSAAFHLVAGALRGDPDVRLRGVNLNPGRTGLLEVMRRMGADVAVEAGDPVAGEPCGDLVVRRADALRATDVEAGDVPSMIDELPLVGLLAAFATGVTTVRGAGELRVKESDRIRTTVAALRGMGVEAEELDDGFSVMGRGRVPGGAMESAGDHRLAMLGVVAGLASDDGVSVGGFEACEVSYPTFARDVAAIGGVKA